MSTTAFTARSVNVAGGSYLSRPGGTSCSLIMEDRRAQSPPNPRLPPASSSSVSRSLLHSNNRTGTTSSTSTSSSDHQGKTDTEYDYYYPEEEEDVDDDDLLTTREPPPKTLSSPSRHSSSPHRMPHRNVQNPVALTLLREGEDDRELVTAMDVSTIQDVPKVSGDLLEIKNQREVATLAKPVPQHPASSTATTSTTTGTSMVPR